MTTAPATPTADDLDLLTRMADAADALTLPGWRSDDVEVEIKDDGSPVTAIDKAVEAALLDLVRADGGGDGFLGEEVGAHPGSSGRTWVVDGIDGTRNFVAERPNWSTLIALTVDGIAVAGMITSPARGERWSTVGDGSAVRTPTGGSSADATALGVSATTELDPGRIAVWPPEAWVLETLGDRHRALFDLVGQPRSSSDLVGEFLPHGAIPVADGRLDAMVAFSGEAWDHAGPSAVVRSAGGACTALDGSDAFDTGAALYSNGLLHPTLLELLAAD